MNSWVADWFKSFRVHYIEPKTIMECIDKPKVDTCPTCDAGHKPTPKWLAQDNGRLIWLNKRDYIKFHTDKMLRESSFLDVIRFYIWEKFKL